MKKTNLILTALLICILFLAGCKKDNVIVTYEPNGGIGTMLAQEFERDVPQALLPNEFYFEDYSFKGWNTAADGSGIKYANEQIVTLKSDVALYAQWRPLSNTYFVLFDANGGTGSIENQPFTAGVAQELVANTFTRVGYIFNGWCTKADGSGIHYRDKSRISLSANLALYAQWTNNTGGGTPCPSAPKVNDIDGNSYNTVQIGSQCWMRENLKTTKYNTGEGSPVITDREQWYRAEIGAMCYYDNDVTNTAVYGALYNAYAVDTENLCPQGWHVPSSDEWNTLASELGGADVAGYVMKTTYDWSPNWYDGSSGNGSNESGFSAFPTGYRTPSGSFYEMGYIAGFWSTSSNSSWSKISRKVDNSNILIHGSDSKEFGYSVRCIKD
jgi:uncharacterized protein (TIGR02145 family)/uncharacterized repeat protein (TIGR02543 family)